MLTFHCRHTKQVSWARMRVGQVMTLMSTCTEVQGPTSVEKKRWVELHNKAQHLLGPKVQNSRNHWFNNSVSVPDWVARREARQATTQATLPSWCRGVWLPHHRQQCRNHSSGSGRAASHFWLQAELCCPLKATGTGSNCAVWPYGVNDAVMYSSNYGILCMMDILPNPTSLEKLRVENSSICFCINQSRQTPVTSDTALRHNSSFGNVVLSALNL